jgi:PAS domain S-box-containing protein
LRASRLSDDVRDSEERMSLAAEAANLGIWVWDVGRDEVWTTDKGRALFGFAPDARLDRAALISRVHPEDRAARDSAIMRALETKGEYSIEYRVLLPDGTLRWIGARGHCMNVGDAKGIRLLGVSMDVTAQKLAQDALRESEARFRTMANTAPVMIWMSGTDTYDDVGGLSSASFSTKVGSTLPAARWSRNLAMGGQRAFTAKTSTAVLKSMLTPLTHGNPSRWNIACDEVTANIAGFWILERRALPSMARSSGTSVRALTSPSAGRPKRKHDSTAKKSRT